MYSLDHRMLEHPRVCYFTKAMKINRPLSLTKRNVITIEDLENISLLCEQFPYGVIFRAVFLMTFFAFLRISNLAAHSISQFNSTVHLTPKDVVISKKNIYDHDIEMD